MAINDPLDHVIAQCGGDVVLALINTWLSLGLYGVFLLLFIHELATMVSRPTVARTSGVLLSVNLVRPGHVQFIIETEPRRPGFQSAPITNNHGNTRV